MINLSPSNQEQAVSLTLIEGSLTIIAFGMSFAWPRLGLQFFSRVESMCGRLARKKGLATLVVGLSALLLRIAILPWCPIPLPFVPGDFSFLLASDTFAHGHLTNPPPPMWVHFESIHIDMQPTYMSMYFPAQGLVMAAGKLLLGNPWFGILIASALMCAAVCWALQGWLPPAWAFLGGMISVLHLGLFSYWINTFHAAGAIAGLGGAMVLGGLPRFKCAPIFRHALVMAVGTALMFTTRPFESLFLFIPVTISLAHWLRVSKKRPAAPVLWRRTAIPLLLLIGAVSWLGYYDYRVFGSPLTLPYTVNRATYAIAPYFIWQSPRPEPSYHHDEMRRFYLTKELDDYRRGRSVVGFVKMAVIKAISGTFFFTGLALAPLFFMFRRVLQDRSVRFIVICLGCLVVGMLVEVFLIPHYVAPFTAAIYTVGMQAMRHMRHWSPGDQPVGKSWTRLTISLLLVMGGLRLFAQPLQLTRPPWPASNWNSNWYGPEVFGKERADIEHMLQHEPGEHLAIVRYAATHNPMDEWVYNAADIDHSKVIWAREMDSGSNRELFEYYKDRRIWLIQPDKYPDAVSTYPLPEKATLNSR
jgi:hypothetical protein